MTVSRKVNLLLTLVTTQILAALQSHFAHCFDRMIKCFWPSMLAFVLYSLMRPWCCLGSLALSLKKK